MNSIHSTKEFYDIVENNPRVIIYFYTKWCPDCFMIKPHLSRLEKEFDTYLFYSFDRDVDIDLARHLEIFGIPSFLVFKDGDEIGRYVDKNRKTYIQVKTFFEDVTNK